MDAVRAHAVEAVRRGEPGVCIPPPLPESIRYTLQGFQTLKGYADSSRAKVQKRMQSALTVEDNIEEVSVFEFVVLNLMGLNLVFASLTSLLTLVCFFLASCPGCTCHGSLKPSR